MRSTRPFPRCPTERVLQLPVGDVRDAARLVVTVATPDGAGPFPLAVVNHGGTGGKPPSSLPRQHLSYLADYFLSRGYAVVQPMMRSYGGSSGALRVYDCDLLALGNDSVSNLDDVIAFMRQRPEVDGSRIVVTGKVWAAGTASRSARDILPG